MSNFNILFFLDKKKKNLPLDEWEIYSFIKGVVNKTIPDYQISAFLMAAAIHGFSDLEITWLTQAISKSGVIYSIPKQKEKIFIDKHSSGGIGDKVTILLAPLLACANLYVFKSSGRGLGFTGGTIDKLESVGVNTNKTFEEGLLIANKSKIAVVSASKNIAPADKILYSLRDVTSTVDSIPLIAASVMSKKLSFGSDYLFLDIKYGSGSFCKTLEKAQQLSDLMILIGKMSNKKVFTFITSMQQPLGYSVGNALEILEVQKFLSQELQAPDLKEFLLSISSYILVTVGKSSSVEEARETILSYISSGLALEALEKWLEAQEVDIHRFKSREYFSPKYTRDIVSSKKGYFGIVDNEIIGHISHRLGSGRFKVSDDIDYHAGIFVHKKINDLVKEGDLLYTFYSSSPIDLDLEKEILENTIISDEKSFLYPLVLYTS